jgi:Ni/Co efflux regulator RcnB
MRKIILSLLLASVAATPAMAGPRDRDEQQEQKPQSREERQQVRQERQQAREERQQQARPDRATMVRPQQNVQQNNPMFEQRGQRDVQVEQQRTLRERMQERRQAAGNETLRRQDRPVPNVMRDRTRVPVVSTTPRRGTQPPLRVEGRRHGPVNWSTHWRNDHRYDWRRWRDNNRSRFHLSFYYDPFGWGYQPYSIGWRLWPSYYSSRYWINDPWQYRLPYAPAGTRWVRYYDDAVLVDTWTGEVVDVIYNFFW